VDGLLPAGRPLLVVRPPLPSPVLAARPRLLLPVLLPLVLAAAICGALGALAGELLGVGAVGAAGGEPTTLTGSLESAPDAPAPPPANDAHSLRLTALEAACGAAAADAAALRAELAAEAARRGELRATIDSLSQLLPQMAPLAGEPARCELDDSEEDWSWDAEEEGEEAALASGPHMAACAVCGASVASDAPENVVWSGGTMAWGDSGGSAPAILLRDAPGVSLAEGAREREARPSLPSASACSPGCALRRLPHSTCRAAAPRRDRRLPSPPRRAEASLRSLTSGDYLCRDACCAGCGARLGWRYVAAAADADATKVEKTIMSMDCLALH
jgi:hypothetical protein